LEHAYSFELRKLPEEDSMSQIIHLAPDTELRIESPHEAPQYPLDCGWWRFVVTRPEGEGILGELQTKDARSKICFIYFWVARLTGFPHVGHPDRDLYTPSVWRAVIQTAVTRA
jgi:hypothetical protein